MRSTALLAVFAAVAYAQNVTLTTTTTTTSCVTGCFETVHVPSVITHVPYGSACTSKGRSVKPPTQSATVAPTAPPAVTTVVVAPGTTSAAATATTSGPLRATGGAASFHAAGAGVLAVGALFAALL